MRQTDMLEVVGLSERVHPGLLETLDVQTSRRELFPEGCFVLEAEGKVLGYVFSHPVKANTPPELNVPPPLITSQNTQLYLHDLVVAQEMRGNGQARAGVEKVLEVALKFESVSLISVYCTQIFWGRFGFSAIDISATEKLVGYGKGATFMVRSNTLGI